MTIRRGEDWGREVRRPSELRVVGSDERLEGAVEGLAEQDERLARALTDGSGSATAVSGGDIYRTLGATPIGSRSSLRELPLDLLGVGLVDGTRIEAVAHIVARRPRFRGSWWQGAVLFVMNAQFHGELDLAPRGHPNDGFADALWCASRLSVRQRWLAARHARQATHLPHPGIEVARVQSRRWSFDEPLLVFADGALMGSSKAITVEVHPDAAKVFV